jgi:hypothetical protein
MESRIGIPQLLEKMGVKYVTIETSCPFALCLRTDRHYHVVCHACGAIRAGNLSCLTCAELRVTEYALNEHASE